VSSPDLGGKTRSQNEHEWMGTPEEMLDALLNRPSPLSPIVFIQRARDQSATDPTEDRGALQ
jgi:hypothetical protein